MTAVLGTVVPERFTINYLKIIYLLGFHKPKMVFVILLTQNKIENFSNMTSKDIRYVHHESVHNFTAAEEIVPYLISLLQPNSVVDVGCGTGTWLKVFSDNGITDFLGIDGNYVDRNSLKIESTSFIEFDLEIFSAFNIMSLLIVSVILPPTPTKGGGGST